MSTVNSNTDIRINDASDAERVNYNIPNENSIAKRIVKN